MTMEEIEEEIREMKWHLRILSDQVLRIADSLPVEKRERIADLSERIADSAQALIEAINSDETESEADAVAHLRDGIDDVRQQLKLIASELYEMADGLFPQ